MEWYVERTSSRVDANRFYTFFFGMDGQSTSKKEITHERETRFLQILKRKSSTALEFFNPFFSLCSLVWCLASLFVVLLVFHFIFFRADAQSNLNINAGTCDGRDSRLRRTPTAHTDDGRANLNYKWAFEVSVGNRTHSREESRAPQIIDRWEFEWLALAEALFSLCWSV